MVTPTVVTPGHTRLHLADEPDAVAARVRVPSLVHARRPPRDADAPRQAVLLRRRQRAVDPAEVGHLQNTAAEFSF